MEEAALDVSLMLLPWDRYGKLTTRKGQEPDATAQTTDEPEIVEKEVEAEVSQILPCLSS